MATIGERLKHAWNAFTSRSDDKEFSGPLFAESFTSSPNRPRLFLRNERTIISSIYTRIAVDVADSDIRHVRLDKEDRYKEEMTTLLNDCLKNEPNLDQAPRAFRQDIAMTLFDKGVAAVVPVETTVNPENSSFDIKQLRVGEVVSWYPQHVKVSVYNEAIGRRQNITLDKRAVAIIENPLYQVMNEPNSTLQRLIRKLSLLDAADDKVGSERLDILIQLPYTVKSETRRAAAEQRRKDVEFQLRGNPYGIAYIDSTEKITQLNRPAENNLWKQITDLTELLYVQLGITPEVMNGTADEKAMLNYHNRTIKPLMDAIVEEMRRKFLTKTARTQGQSIMYFRDPFKLVPIENIAEIADKFTRNEILSANEIRQIIGRKPSKDPKADELRNSNMPAPEGSEPTPPKEGDGPNE